MTAWILTEPLEGRVLAFVGALRRVSNSNTLWAKIQNWDKVAGPIGTFPPPTRVECGS